MVQIPTAVTQAAAQRKRTNQEAAEYLEGLANDMASDGWEFDGLEEMTVVTPPGCLGIGQPQHTPVYVATFKRSKTTHDQVNG